jgi:hypothetical protein
MDFDKAARINELCSLSNDIRYIAKMLEDDNEDKDVVLSQLRSSIALLVDTSNQMHDEWS